jgi:hypothetical protein
MSLVGNLMLFGRAGRWVRLLLRLEGWCRGISGFLLISAWVMLV